ncbi:MAG TPA: nucleotide sugar dehydrogenase [Candidatus Omnitrophota bacterium]|nr:nucleotide sugar dehydrogenase [Candidatus Omnitrophota bacterium]
MTSKAETVLQEKIKNRKLKAGIIGLGYVGLPLAVEFAKAGIEVCGIDIDARKISSLRQGKSYIQDVPTEEVAELVAEKKLRATTDFSAIRELDTINICVPTPLRKSKDPDISYIVSAAQEIARYFHRGMLVILESTTYPGTTEEVIRPMLEEKGFAVGEDFFLAFSPERVDPGNPHYQTRNIPKVVGGATPACTRLAAAFYELAIAKVHPVSSCASAEMVKLLENTFRSVNIGLVNELCLMSEKLGVDIWEIIDAAATKPFGFMPFYPGPGLGGHCIPIDPHYLAWKARIHGFNPRFIELASAVNAEMPEFVVRKVQAVLNEKGKAVKGAKILILGLSYKKNVDDIRESPALEIIELLEKSGAAVSYSDPHVPEISLHGKVYRSVPLASAKKAFDAAILVTDHAGFDYPSIAKKFPLVLDTRNAFRGIVSEKIKKI